MAYNLEKFLLPDLAAYLAVIANRVTGVSEEESPRIRRQIRLSR